MPGINFLDNQQHDDQKPKNKDDQKAKPVWSEPKKEDKTPKSSAFSFLPFIGKKEPADKSSVSAIDKNKIKQSREEILNLIKHHEDSKLLVKEKNKNFLTTLGEKLKKQPGRQEVLIDYQRVFNQEKEHKNQIGKIFNIKPALETKPAPPLAGKSKDSWFNGLIKSFKNKVIALSAHKNEAPKMVKLPRAEEIKPVVAKPPAAPRPVIQIKPAPPLSGKPKDNWFEKLAEPFKNRDIALSAHKNEASKMVKLPRAEEIKPVVVKPPAVPPPLTLIRPEEKLAEIKEIKAEEPEPIHKNEIRQRVIETNLIQGELVTFFDWHSKIIISASAILMPIFVIGAVYYGLVFYQKSNQAKNLAQAQKFAELEQNITKEEAGVKEIAGFETQLKTVSQVFEQHLYWTNFFKFLEDNTIKDVYFVNFDGDTSGNYIMDALAVNYSGIAEQANVFKNNKKITAVEAEGGDMVAGDNTSQSLVKFVLNFTVLKNIFTE